MIKFYKMLLITLCLISLTQCTEQDPEPVKPATHNPMFQHQINALKRAKKVNQIILDAAKKKRKKINNID
ncbi:hypothetical protein MNBD_GAMMA12-587 [hydrothermal vent metagenome]|uniref:Uncharacterized protein n=1 Tax=hydrothermal vent metagenome TaxID=652676 RepID=A0A3B0YT53_9ZZZZ